MRLEKSFLNQLNLLSDLILVSTCYFILIFYLSNYLDFNVILWLIIPFVLLSFGPILILHFNYLNKNEGVIFEVGKGILIKRSRAEILEFNDQDISAIVFYINHTKDTGYGSVLYKKYYYAKVELLDGSSFVITSLYSSKIDKILKENFKDVKITTEKVFYPMIRNEETK
jgi:hypothetical protein